MIRDATDDITITTRITSHSGEVGMETRANRRGDERLSVPRTENDVDNHKREGLRHDFESGFRPFLQKDDRFERDWISTLSATNRAVDPGNYRRLPESDFDRS